MRVNIFGLLRLSEAQAFSKKGLPPQRTTGVESKACAQNQKDWATLSDPTEKFNAYATELALDMNRFASDQNSEVTLKKIQDDVDSGNDSGVRGTPTFFLNGKAINPGGTYEGFKQLIDDALAR